MAEEQRTGPNMSIRPSVDKGEPIPERLLTLARRLQGALDVYEDTALKEPLQAGKAGQGVEPEGEE